MITVAQYGYAGTLTGEVFAMSAVGAPAVMLGIYVGGILCRRLSQRMFQYIINILILVAGIINCVANG